MADDGNFGHPWWNEYRGFAKHYNANGPLIGEIWPNASQFLAPYHDTMYEAGVKYAPSDRLLVTLDGFRMTRPFAQTNPANGVFNTAVEFNSEPIRLTFDASKAIWGPKFTHFVDVWVAYRYWQNKFGLDHKTSTACNVTPGVSNNSCTESTVYTGVTVKF